MGSHRQTLDVLNGQTRFLVRARQALECLAPRACVDCLPAAREELRRRGR
jgi:hypothetical protein